MVEIKVLEEEARGLFGECNGFDINCLKKPIEVNEKYLPCHLQDTQWLAELINRRLVAKGVCLSKRKIFAYVEKSKKFDDMRHDYELSLVKNFILQKVGEIKQRQKPSSYDEWTLKMNQDFVRIVRDGVLSGLKAIGLDPKIIEEGLEGDSKWRQECLSMGFDNRYNPDFCRENLKETSPYLEGNWFALCEYEYYLEHKDVVDKFGKASESMRMSHYEYMQRLSIFNDQHRNRMEEIASVCKLNDIDAGRNA